MAQDAMSVAYTAAMGKDGDGAGAASRRTETPTQPEAETATPPPLPKSWDQPSAVSKLPAAPVCTEGAEVWVCCSKCRRPVTDSSMLNKTSGSTVTCNLCNTKRSTMSQMFGKWPIDEFVELPPEAQTEFWVAEAKGKKALQEQLAIKLTENREIVTKAGAKGEYLPLSVYAARGFNVDDIVNKCTDVQEHEVLGKTYCVHIERNGWEDTYKVVLDQIRSLQANARGNRLSALADLKRAPPSSSSGSSDSSDSDSSGSEPAPKSAKMSEKEKQRLEKIQQKAKAREEAKQKRALVKAAKDAERDRVRALAKQKKAEEQKEKSKCNKAAAAERKAKAEALKLAQKTVQVLSGPLALAKQDEQRVREQLGEALALQVKSAVMTADRYLEEATGVLALNDPPGGLSFSASDVQLAVRTLEKARKDMQKPM